MNFKTLFWPALVILLLPTVSYGADPISSTPSLAQPSTRAPFQWRKDPRFEKFVPDPALPEMVALDKTKLQIGRTFSLSMTALNTISVQEKDALAKLLNVPQTVVSNLIASCVKEQWADADTLGKELRACITDYKFLVHVWNEFVSLEQESPKKEARAALAAGEVEKAWQLYPAPASDHPKPPPPLNLRIVKDSENVALPAK